MSFANLNHVGWSIKIIRMLASGDSEWCACPFISNCFVVSPMRFVYESCVVMECCIRTGMPVLILPVRQVGTAALAPIAVAIVQYVNAIIKGHPAVFGTWPFISDLRTGEMSGSLAEQAALTAGCTQMHRFYDCLAEQRTLWRGSPDSPWFTSPLVCNRPFSVSVSIASYLATISLVRLCDTRN